jgi:cobalamin biosynthesis Co2+ chelatase CbiK
MIANVKKQAQATKKNSFKPNHGRIFHQEILNSSEDYARIIEIYQNKVLSQKTRSISLLGRKNSSKIILTLLGYEVQASYKRIQCPDLVTARYIRLFSELGFHSIKLPYDPTMTAQLVPDFEKAVNAIMQKIRERFPQDMPTQNYVSRKICEIIRSRIASL